MKTTKLEVTGGGLCRSKLLAAIAVLAIAFAVFAAVPAVADDSDANTTPVDVDTASDITDGASNGILKLTANTTWNLKADVSVTTLKQINLAGYTLTIQSDPDAKANYTLTLTSAATDVSFIINSGNTQSSVIVDKADVELTGNTTTATFINMNAESPQGVVFDIKNASNVTVEANGAHSAVQTANNTVFKVSGASALDFIGNSGVQCAYFDISGKSVVNADIGNASVAGYFNMNDANVNVENINIYGAKLVASDINATGFVGVYAKQSTTSNIAGQTAAINASEITLFTDSEIVSPELYNGLYNAVSGTSTANGTAAKFTDGTVEFQNINADSKAATGWTFNGTTVRGATTVEAAKDANVTITGGDNGLILGENASLTLVEGNKFVGKIGYIADDGKAKLTTVSENGLVAGTDGLTFSEGSVVLSGTINATTAVTITANGDVEIDGATITGTTTTAGGLTVTIDNGAGNSVSVVGKLTVAEGGSLTVTQGSKLTVDPKATLAVGGTVSGAIDNKGTIALISQKANVADADVTGTGTVDSSAIASEGTISGSFDTTTTFTKNQVITATGDVTLVKGTVFTFEGTLIIPEGIKFVVEDGAQLIVSGIAGKIENNGAIIIESKSQSSITPTGASEAVDRNGGFVIMGGSEVTNNGTITLDYTLPEVPSTYYSMNIASKFTNNGNVVVGEDSELVISATNAVNGVDGTFSIAGAFSIDALANAGLVTINGEVTKASNISLTSVDAKVDIVSIAGSFLLSVNNTGFNSDEKLNIVNDEAQKINIKAGTGTDASSSKQVIEGISITLKTEKTEDYTQSDEKPLYQQFVVSGKITTSFVDTTVDSEKLGISYVSAYGRAVVSEAVSVGEKITFTVKNDSDLIVRGTFDVVKGGVFNIGAADSNITGSAAGEVTVTGKLTLIAADLDATEKSRINAASYTVASTTETDKKYVYTAFATAVADGAKVINILGENDVDVDVTIPADVSVIFSNTGDMAIDEDAEVSFETGSILKNAGSGIDVDGVLYIADVKGTLKSGADKIVSDVTINGEKDRTYCGLAYALGNAKEGDVVKLSNDLTGDNAISKNLIIPAGVTLDTNGYDVVVEKNVTVTVNGTLFIDNDRENSIITLNPGTSAADKDAKIVANGVVKSDNRSILEMGLDITGAYYVIETNTDDTYYVEPVENAVGKIADAGALSYGADSVNMVVMNYDADAALKVSDITVTGKSADEPAVILFALNDVEIKSITLDNAAAAFADIDVNAVITNSVGTVTVNGNSSIFTVGSTNIDDVKTLVIAGGFEEFADTDDRTYAFTVAGVASLSTCDIDKIVVDGTLNVLADSDADKAVIGTLVVNGTFNVPSDTYASITEAEVYGTFSVAELTTEQNAGTATVDEMYVGISMKDAENDTSGAAGTVTGPVDVTKYVVVAPGSTVPEAITEENSTQFYVEDTLYITVYTVDGNAKIGEFKTKVENADFQYWSKGTENANDKKVGDVGYEKVTAKIVYEVYNVVILADVGVNDVSIDGNLMLANGANSYYAIVAAGKHTITYNLANGYTGEAKLAVNGSVFDGATCTLDGMNFDISGKFNETTNGYDTVVTLQLTGIEKSGFVPDAPDSSDNGGMTITDYLLIILVVLIVVMAIIVAMRLMRS